MVLKEKKPNEEPDAGEGRVYVGLSSWKISPFAAMFYHVPWPHSIVVHGYRTRLLDPLTHGPGAARFALGSVHCATIYMNFHPMLLTIGERFCCSKGQARHILCFPSCVLQSFM